MTRQKKNTIRAIFLLVVFTMNMAAGFACSVGIDLGYNEAHHDKVSHSHETEHQHKHVSEHKHSHSHAHAHEAAKVNSGEEKKDCCSDEVASFTQLDKSVVYNNLLIQAPQFLVATLTAFFLIDKLAPAPTDNSRFGAFRRSCSTYDTDIRIAIQSFQI